MPGSKYVSQSGVEIDFVDGFFDHIDQWSWGIDNFEEFVETVFVDPYYPEKDLGFLLIKSQLRTDG